MFLPCSGYSYLICDHMRAVYLYISALENSCPLMAFPCANYKAFLAGQCLDCFNPFLLSCPRIGKCHSFGFLWQFGEFQALLVITSLSPAPVVSLSNRSKEIHQWDVQPVPTWKMGFGLPHPTLLPLYCYLILYLLCTYPSDIAPCLQVQAKDTL